MLAEAEDLEMVNPPFHITSPFHRGSGLPRGLPTISFHFLLAQGTQCASKPQLLSSCKFITKRRLGLLEVLVGVASRR